MSETETGHQERHEATVAELSRLRGVVEAIQALAVDAKVAISRGCLCSGDNCTGKCGAGKPLGWTLDPEQVLAVLAPVSSSGEAESGEGRGDCTICGLDDRTCTTRHADGADPCCEACRYGDTDEPTPAPVPSGGQADGEGEDAHTLAALIREHADSVRAIFNAPMAAGSLHRVADRVETLAARPVLSREALARLLGEHAPVYDYRDGRFTMECEACDFKMGGVDREDMKRRFGEHFAGLVLAGGDQDG